MISIESIGPWLAGVISGALIEWILARARDRALFEELKLALLDREQIDLREEFLLTQQLADKILKADFKPDLIVAISPGGLMIAEWLARRFLGDYQRNIPIRAINVETIRVSAGVTAEKAVVRSNRESVISGFNVDSKVLLVNDISRGGATLRCAIEFLRNSFREHNVKDAALFTYTHAKPEFHAIATKKEIRFDWKEQR
jgi:hypoxanthine phosphoribosyltransferase